MSTKRRFKIYSATITKGVNGEAIGEAVEQFDGRIDLYLDSQALYELAKRGAKLHLAALVDASVYRPPKPTLPPPAPADFSKLIGDRPWPNRARHAPACSSLTRGGECNCGAYGG